MRLFVALAVSFVALIIVERRSGFEAAVIAALALIIALVSPGVTP